MRGIFLLGLAGPAAATAVPVVPVGVRAAVARTIGSTIAIQAPVAQGGASIAIQAPIAQGGASIAIQAPVAQGGASIAQGGAPKDGCSRGSHN